MQEKSRGMIEAEISNELIKFEKEYMGRGPLETRTYILENIVIVRLTKVLTRSEEQLSRTEEGITLIKKVRSTLFEQSSHLLDAIISDILGCKVLSMHTDISTKTGERIIVFILDQDIGDNFKRSRHSLQQ